MSTTEWLTAVLVGITAFYAWATFRILKANEAVVAAMDRQTEAQLRPYVTIFAFARTGTTLLTLEIVNAGRSPAQNLRLKMDKSFYSNADNAPTNDISRMPAFTDTIESLAPGSRLHFILGVGSTILGSNANESVCPKSFEITARYQFGDRSYIEANKIDLRPMAYAAVVHDPVATEIQKLREAIEKNIK